KGFVRKDVIETEIVDNTATNILTQIDRVSKLFPEFRRDYDLLSERTHPNGLGALDYFWESGDDVMKFSNSVDHDHSILSLLSAGRWLAVMDRRMSLVEAELKKADWMKMPRTSPKR